VKALLKTSALTLVVVLSVRRLVPTVMGSGSLPVSSLLSICVSTALSVLRYAAVAGLVMAAADYAVVRKRNNKQLKMTKQEVKEELKSSEGDPRLRGAVRSRQLAMRRNRMMADVPHADVVVVNPTHVAVALRYDPSRGAPRVVAKGADHVAARIRALAEENRVPMVSDVPLARTLYQACDLGQEIPADLYKAVATVLAFIMTLKKRGSAAGVHRVHTLATR
jgi:flagellar biosynthesis protein FlhB